MSNSQEESRGDKIQTNIDEQPLDWFNVILVTVLVWCLTLWYAYWQKKRLIIEKP